MADNYRVERYLEERLSNFDFMRDLTQEIISWDGTLVDTPMDFWPMEDLPYMVREIFSGDALLEIFQDAQNGQFDATHKYFYFDACGGWESTDEPDFEAYISDMAEWLVENYETRAFPDWLEDDEELIDAISKTIHYNEEDIF